jgi:hypothetical protein
MKKLHTVGWFIAGFVGFGLASMGCSSLIGINDVPNPAGDGGGGGTDGTVGGGDGSHPQGDSGGGGGQDGAGGGGDSAPGVDAKADGGTKPPPDGGGSPDVGSSVLEYHNNPARDGHYIDPLMTTTYAANLKFDTTFGSPTAPGVPIQGPLWGQVLYAQNGVGGKGTFYVADDGNDVYAIDEATGSTDWFKTPLLTPASTGQCPGNIQPLGITSAPYIDMSSRTMYLAAATGTATSGIKTYMIYALSIDDGSTVSGWPIDVSTLTSSGGTAFNPGPQNQRGGLALLNGYLYVDFGGQDGDCGNYNGWVVAVPVADPSKATGFATAAQGGGMWTVAGLVSDGTDMFSVSGNATGGSGTNWSDYESEGVFRFTNGTAFDPTNTKNWFSPTNWQSLDGSDTDLTGAGPLALDVPGATPSALVVAMGKSGVMHLLDRSNLGGIFSGGNGVTGEGINSAQVGTQDLRGAAAAYTTSTGTYIVVHTDGNGQSCPMGSGNLVAVQITATSPPTIQPAWCANSGGSGSPIVTTTDASGSNAIVWVVGAEGSNQLTGWDGNTGASIFNGGGLGMDNVIHWTTPIDANGRIIVGSSDKVYAFTGM